MRDWLARLLGAPPPPPVDPPPAAPPPPPRPRSWQAELMAEADFAWDAARGPLAAPEAEDGPPGALPAGVTAADLLAPASSISPPAPPAWVRPAVDQPRAAFTRFGYEPGKRPPSLTALQDLYERVYGPSLAPLAGRVLHDLALYGALEGWRAGANDLGRLHVAFRQLSAIMGDALGFDPAPLKRVDHHRTLGGFYDHGEKAIFLATSVLAAHPAAAVNTIAHEQAHRLQHLLIQQYQYAPRKLTPAERSLAAYWHDEGTAEPGADYARYRYNGREYTADWTGKAVTRSLMPLFGWGPEVLRF